MLVGLIISQLARGVDPACWSVDPVLRHGIDAALGQRLVFALIVFKIVNLHVYPADTDVEPELF